MSYIELFKKYRPKTWDDIVGQEEVVKSLRKAVLDKNVPTAYLFAGKQHGCGKTSCALILTKALNCLNLDPETGNPCNECKVCTNIDNDKQLGVNYISMANKGSAQEVRKIVEQAQIMQPINRQVWILDECHAMSKEAAESLLIPLENTKMKALFIFCSTEPEKIIPTVKSRLQLRTFTPVSEKSIAKHLFKIAKMENLKLTKEQIIEAAIEGKGSLRDSLNNLETLASGKEINVSFKNKVLNAINKADYVAMLSLSSQMSKEGIDFKKTLEQLYRDFADMLLLSAGAELSGLVKKEAYKKMAEHIGPNNLMKGARIIGEGIQTMSINVTIDGRIIFELTMWTLVDLLKGGK